MLLLIALAIALPTTSLGADSKLVFARCLVLATICLIGWIALRVLHIGANLYLRNFRIDSPDNQVTNANPEAIELRILVTAASVSDTSNLCAELREKLIVFLQNECPQALPRRRHEISELPVRRTKGRNTASNE